MNENWNSKTSIHLSAYVMWRLNWIHPFDDGNGRTSRAASYLVLCAHRKMLLPGIKSIPEQIAKDKTSYYSALEDADKNFKNSREVDLQSLEKLLAELLAKQLLSIVESANKVEADTIEPSYH